jgi:hypothetical protein
MTRYWFILDPANPYGRHNIGVTAYAAEDALSIASDTARRLGWTDSDMEALAKAEYIANIDVRLLEQEHIIPNMGPVNIRRVWWPRANL